MTTVPKGDWHDPVHAQENRTFTESEYSQDGNDESWTLEERNEIELCEKFNAFDKNGSGEIDVNELQEILSEEKRKPFQINVLKSLMGKRK
ncbi:unnamed protein product, partial [Didymodactylos carnosus]